MIRRRALVAMAVLFLGTGCGGGPAVEVAPPPEPTAGGEAQPDEAVAAHGAATTLLSQGDLERARAAAGRAVELRPDDADHQETLGRVCAAQGDATCAREAFGRALSIDGTRDELHGPLGDAHRELGDAQAAESAYRRAMAANGDDVPVRLSLVELLVARAQGPADASASELSVEGRGLCREGWRILEESPIEISAEPHEPRYRAARRALLAMAPELSRRGTGSTGRSGTTGAGVGQGVSAGLRMRRARMPVVPSGVARSGRPLDPRVVRGVIRERAQEINYCYEREFRRRPDLEGAVVIEARIGTDGAVASASVASATLEDRGVQDCVLEIFRRLRFPRADGETRVHHPFNFSPGGR